MGISQCKKTSFYSYPPSGCTFLDSPKPLDPAQLESSASSPTSPHSSYSGFTKLLLLGDCGVGKSSLLKSKNFVKSCTSRDKSYSVVLVPDEKEMNCNDDRDFKISKDLGNKSPRGSGDQWNKAASGNIPRSPRASNGDQWSRNASMNIPKSPRSKSGDFKIKDLGNKSPPGSNEDQWNKAASGNIPKSPRASSGDQWNKTASVNIPKNNGELCPKSAIASREFNPKIPRVNNGENSHKIAIGNRDLSLKIPTGINGDLNPKNHRDISPKIRPGNIGDLNLKIPIGISDNSPKNTNGLHRDTSPPGNNADFHYKITNGNHRDTSPKNHNGNNGDNLSLKISGFREVLLEIWDVGLQAADEYRHYQCKPFRGVDAVLICFDVNDPYSWGNVKRWFNDTDRFLSENALRIIVGCKADHKAISNLLKCSNFFKENHKKKLKKLFSETTHDNHPSDHLCQPQLFCALWSHLSLTELLNLRLVCKWFYNATLKIARKKLTIENPYQTSLLQEEVMEYAQQMNAKVFYTSAKYRYGIDELFLTVIMDVINNKRDH